MLSLLIYQTIPTTKFSLNQICLTTNILLILMINLHLVFKIRLLLVTHQCVRNSRLPPVNHVCVDGYLWSPFRIFPDQVATVHLKAVLTRCFTSGHLSACKQCPLMCKQYNITIGPPSICKRF